jgi:hypothetical protein
VPVARKREFFLTDELSSILQPSRFFIEKLDNEKMDKYYSR